MKGKITFDLMADDHVYFVLDEALSEFAAHERHLADNDPDTSPSRREWADTADAMRERIDAAVGSPDTTALAAEIAGAVRGRRELWTSPAQRQAAELLADLYRAGELHDLTGADWRPYNEHSILAGAAVDAIAQRLRRTAPADQDQANTLVERLAATLTAAGVTARTGHEGGVTWAEIDRTDASPAWGRDGDAGLLVRCWPATTGIEAGWDIGVSGGIGLRLVAGHDNADVAGIVEIVGDLLAGKLGNPLNW